MGFFEKWETPQQVRNIQFLLVGLIFIFLVFVQTTLPDDKSAPVFIGVFVMGVVLNLWSGSSSLGWGKSLKKALESFAIGIAVVVVLNIISGNIKLAIPVSLPFALFNVPSIVYITIIAPFIEETTFREGITAFFDKITKNFALSLVLSSAAFGIFHLAAYSAYAMTQGIPIEGLLWQAALFGFIAGFGNVVLKSTAFGLGLHISNNIIAFTRAIAG